LDIQLLSEQKLYQSFHPLGCKTRYEIASALGHIFPELAWKLPPAKRLWESEARRMAIFDAAALGLAYWQHEATSVPLPQDQSIDE
jgi:hypothetical protein